MNTSSELPKGLPVGIWLRVSTEDQANGDSLKHHEIRARAFAGIHNYEVVETYNLAGVSGKSVKDHPEAKRMMEDVKRGRIKALIFSKLARFARNTKELIEFADHFKSHNAALISLQESIDTGSSIGRLFYTMIAAMAQWEREEIGDRVRASMLTRAKLGTPLSGVTPYGYHWVGKKMVQKPEEAPVRKRAYELFRKLHRKGTVAKLLNEAGHRTRQGKTWRDISIGRILIDPSAKGTYFLNRTKNVGTWKVEIKPESEWGRIDVEPIVSEELWDEVNRILEEQDSKPKRKAKRPKQLFSGIAVCACGGKMYVPSGSPKYVCQKCRKKIPAEDLEDFFLGQVKDYFTNPARLTVHIEGLQAAIGEKANLLQVQQQEVKKIEDDIARTHRLFLDNTIDEARFKEFYAPLEIRLKQLQADIPRLEAELDTKRLNDLTAEVVKKEATDLYDRWSDRELETKREVVESLVQSIVIDFASMDISVNFLARGISVESTNSQQSLCRLMDATPSFGTFGTRLVGDFARLPQLRCSHGPLGRAKKNAVRACRVAL